LAAGLPRTGERPSARHVVPAREWRVRPDPPTGFAESIGLPEFQARLLYNRDVRSRSQAEAFRAADLRLSNDPFLLPDMRQAVDRLRRAVEAGETIAVFGDFDADGLTGAAVVSMALTELGARVVPYLPDRASEGHGLNALAVGSIRAQGVTTMVTVDCGSTSVDEIELASALGIDTIVTDHHSLPGELPCALAVVNPKREDSRYPYLGLTGAGLSYKLVEALWADLGKPLPEHFLEIAALGTVADVGPLTGENRYIVKRGLELLNSTCHPGIEALIERSGLEKGKIDSRGVSFGLVPRLNASGRLGDAHLSLHLLTATTKEKAVSLADRLEEANERRRELSQLAHKQAMEQVESNGSSADPIIFVEHREWVPGILGLVAGRLSEVFHRPVAAVAVGPQVSRASMRSIPEFDVVEALGLIEDRLVRYGGHSAAAGFTVPTHGLEDLKAAMCGIASSQRSAAGAVPYIEIDCEADPSVVDRTNLDFIESLAPFGEGNPAPVLMTTGMRVSERRTVGRSNAHLKMWLVHEGRMWEAIAFNQGDQDVAAGDVVDAVYNVGLNDWGGVTRMELRVLDVRRSGLAPLS
jgi:single-stranded-DNA-specific exonuclease